MMILGRQLLISLLTAFVVLAGFTLPPPAIATETWRIGVCPGPYGAMVEEGIAPVVRARHGIVIEVVEFPDYIMPNNALVSGDIIANLMQHRRFFNNAITSLGLDLEAVISVPTLAMGAFSQRYHSLSQLQRGDVLLIPNDGINTPRALRMIRDAGLIALRDRDDELKLSLDDVLENPLELRFEMVDAAQISRTLDAVAVGFVPGNYAHAAGLDYAQALAVEEVLEDIKNLVVVRRDDAASVGTVLREAVESPEFHAYIEGDARYRGFARPAWWQQ